MRIKFKKSDIHLNIDVNADIAVNYKNTGYSCYRDGEGVLCIMRLDLHHEGVIFKFARKKDAKKFIYKRFYGDIKYEIRYT